MQNQDCYNFENNGSEGSDAITIIITLLFVIGAIIYAELNKN
tara:strand:+ start:268 stop:393 length:126 start_codon:yes stop_codon:yes gene_type:complete